MATSPKKARRSRKASSAAPKKREAESPFTITHATFPIVGIGASAGGLEAFSKLLHALPLNPGLALVFVPHLDPTHESAMVELLARTTPLPVIQAAEGARVECNRVYVLAPNCEITIADGILHLATRGLTGGHHMPVDTFFCSLADDHTSNAIGVILSGTANDGTLGLSAIKNSGGITFAQD